MSLLRWIITLIVILSLITPAFTTELTTDELGQGPPPPPAATTTATTVTVSDTNVAPHVQAVQVTRAYNDEYDEDEDADEDDLPRPIPSVPAQVILPSPVVVRSIDERIAAQKNKIEQLKNMLSKQREQHAATAKLISDHNKEIQAKIAKHQAEMQRAAAVVKRRTAIDRVEKTEDAAKAAAKRAAELKAQREVQALQNQLARQHAAAVRAQQALVRQEREDATRQRVMAQQHEHYEKLEAELKAHEAEFVRTRGKPIKLLPSPPTAKKTSIRRPSFRVRRPSFRRPSFRRPSFRRPSFRNRRIGTFRRRPILRRPPFLTPRRAQSNPFRRISINPRWRPKRQQQPRRRILSPTLRRWIIIRTVQARRTARATQPKIPTISVTIARQQYKRARQQLRNTMRSIIRKPRQWKRRAALTEFKKLSEQLSVTAALAHRALIRTNRGLHRKLNRIQGQLRRLQRQRPRVIIRRPRRSSNRRRWSKKPKNVKKWWKRQSKPQSRWRNRKNRNIRFNLSSKPYPQLVSTRDASGLPPRSSILKLKAKIDKN